MIAIEKEIKHLKNYVALQKARSNDNMEVTLDINYADGTVKVAPLNFMAFVENAFKYASRDDKATNRIVISLKQQGGKIDFVHQSFLVNRSKIESVEGNDLKVGTKSLPISRNYRDSVMGLINQRLLKR